MVTIPHARRFTEVTLQNWGNVPSYDQIVKSIDVNPSRIAVVVIDVGAPGSNCAQIENCTLTKIKPVCDAVRTAGGKVFHAPSAAAAHPALFGEGDFDFGTTISDVPSHAQIVLNKLKESFCGWPELIIHMGYAADRCLMTRPAGIHWLAWYGDRQPAPLTAKFLLPCDCTMAREVYQSVPLYGSRWQTSCETYALYVEGRSHTVWNGKSIVDALAGVTG